MIPQLCAEHRVLEAHAALLLRIVAVPVPDAASVAAMRWRMAQALLDHCRTEDEHIYDPLIAAGDRVAVQYREEHGALAKAFANYIAAWPVERIAREWKRFGVETEMMLVELEMRIAREEDMLYPHAARVTAREAA